MPFGAEMPPYLTAIIKFKVLLLQHLLPILLRHPLLLLPLPRGEVVVGKNGATTTRTSERMAAMEHYPLTILLQLRPFLPSSTVLRFTCSSNIITPSAPNAPTTPPVPPVGVVLRFLRPQLPPNRALLLPRMLQASWVSFLLFIEVVDVERHLCLYYSTNSLYNVVFFPAHCCAAAEWYLSFNYFIGWIYI